MITDGKPSCVREKDGDYYMNSTRIVDGNSHHGFYVHEVDENNGFKTHSSTFHVIPTHTTRTTINIDKHFDLLIRSSRRFGWCGSFNLQIE